MPRKPTHQPNSISDLFASLDRSRSVHTESLSRIFSNESSTHLTRAKAKKVVVDQHHLSSLVSHLPNFSSYERHQLLVESGSDDLENRIKDQCVASVQQKMKNLEIDSDHSQTKYSSHAVNNVHLVCSTPGQGLSERNRAARVVPFERLDATPIPCPQLTDSEEFLIQPVSPIINQPTLPSASGEFKPTEPHCEPRSVTEVITTDKLVRSNDATQPELRFSPRHSLALMEPGKRSAAFIKRLTRKLRVDNMILNQSYWALYESGNSRATLLKLCKQDNYAKFSQVFASARQRKSIKKIGEGCFGEVFRCCSAEDPELAVAVKLIPIEGEVLFNGDPQKTFDEVLSEVIVAKELTALNHSWRNRTENFVQLQRVCLVQGAFPSYLTKAWERYARDCKSENDHPKIFPKSQLWLIIESAFSGSSLENNVPSCPAARLSILRQIALALACAESELRFEHRDLHWGNVLIKSDPHLPSVGNVGGCIHCQGTDAKQNLVFVLGERRYEVPTFGVHAVIIDFTLSRLEQDGGCVYVNLAADPGLFESEGDYQFEIYRLMREHNNNRWDTFCPKSNVMWLHYLATKLLDASTSGDARLSSHSLVQQQLVQFEQHLRSFPYNSITELTTEHPLFVDLVH